MTSSWIAFDTESAVAAGCPHLLELGAVRVVDGRIAERFEELVRPRIEIDRLPGAADAVHRMRDSDLRDARPAAEVLERFWRWCAGDVLVAHAARGDGHLIAFEQRRAGLELPPARLVDSLALCRRAFPSARDHRLETLCRDHGLATELPHRALADAELCARVVLVARDVLGAARSAGDVEREWIFEPRARRGVLTLEACAPRRVRTSPLASALEDARREQRSIALALETPSEATSKERSSARSSPLARSGAVELVPWLLFRRRARDHVEGWDVRERRSVVLRLEELVLTRPRR